MGMVVLFMWGLLATVDLIMTKKENRKKNKKIRR